MRDELSNRKNPWNPPSRPEWVRQINEEGNSMDSKGVVPLDENSLLDAARANTGLTDFGEQDWYEPFQVLIKSLEEEAQLNLMGRILTRSDLLMYLEARLQITETYRLHPEIEDEVIEKPLMIIGQGRSGTSALQNLLSHDPNNGTITDWETFFPCPPPEKATYHSDPRIAKADHVLDLYKRVIPEIESMHEFSATLPTENIHVHCLSFRSVDWFNTFGGEVPGYTAYMQTQSMLPAYQYEKKVLKLLQWKNPRKQWVLKSPACILRLPTILEVYPDIGFIWTHRDPVKALTSLVNLIGTLMWARSDYPFSGSSWDTFTTAEAGGMMLSQPIDWLESGVLPKERLCNVYYQDFVKDPMGVVKAIYDYFDINYPEQSRQAMQKYIDDNPREARPAHKYSSGDQASIDRNRKAYQRYQQYFNVPNEL